MVLAGRAVSLAVLYDNGLVADAAVHGDVLGRVCFQLAPFGDAVHRAARIVAGDQLVSRLKQGLGG